MFEILPFKAEHLPQVMALENELFPDTAWSESTYLSELELVGQSRVYWVVVEDEQVIGYAGLYYLPPESDIQTIAVAQPHQGRGIGTCLMNQLIAEAKERGCHKMMLEVEVGNTSARDLYLKFGFRELGTRVNYYGPGLDCVVMELPDLSEARHG